MLLWPKQFAEYRCHLISDPVIVRLGQHRTDVLAEWVALLLRILEVPDPKTGHPRSVVVCLSHSRQIPI
jgi:hypothetical protein